MTLPTSDCPCEQFPGRLKDLCLGVGLDGRPNPQAKHVAAFREQHGFAPLPARTNAATPVADHGKPQKPREPKPPQPKGVGTHLKEIFASLGQKYRSEGCGCNELAGHMNAIGVEGCRREFDELVGLLKEKAKRLNWWDTLRLGAKSVGARLAFKLSARGLLSEAIRRAEKSPCEKCAVESEGKDLGPSSPGRRLNRG